MPADIVADYYDTGVIIAEAGPGTKTYMRLDQPGEYFDGQGQPVSERDAARAGFDVAHWRAEARAKRIKEAAAAHAERIRAKAKEQPPTLKERTATAVAKVEREQARKVQAEADRQLTSYLDKLPRLP
jgi:hypothetical protein